ncbi:MAG: glycosyltransferase family 39 protein [Chloroflexi bacterium]|nr:glycosyltransferase family 39 protein [Chloroflexota bacterium]
MSRQSAVGSREAGIGGREAAVERGGRESKGGSRESGGGLPTADYRLPTAGTDDALTSGLRSAIWERVDLETGQHVEEGLLPVVIPVLCFAVIFLACRRRTGCGDADWRRAFLPAALVWGVLLTAATEVLGALRLLSFGWLVGFWTLASVVAALVAGSCRSGASHRFSNGLSSIAQRLADRHDHCPADMDAMPVGLGLVPRRTLHGAAGEGQAPALREGADSDGGLPNIPAGPAGQKGTQSAVATIPRFHAVLLGWLLSEAAILGVIALAAPPNTWDSMTYHMPRVVHWIQQGSVDHYPTSVLRQLYQNPWAELAILHLQVLSGGDRFANLVQWFSMVGSVVGASLIARQLGAGGRAQVFAALVAATLPMGILQATSTQNDAVVAFWLVCFVSFLLAFRKQPRWAHALGVGAGLGLAVLAKGTAYLYAFPFLAWFVVSGRRAIGPRFWLFALVVGAIALFLNVGHFWRNTAFFGFPLDAGQESYVSESLSMRAFASTLARNIAIQLRTPLPEVNRLTEQAVLALHVALGADASDPRTTWVGTAFQVSAASTHEDDAGNPLHLLLALLAIALLFCRLVNRSGGAHTGEPGAGASTPNQGALPARSWRCSARTPGSLRNSTDSITAGGGRDRRVLVAYLTACTVAFLLFSLLRWQPWNSRLHLPLFVLLAPFAATVLGAVLGRRVMGTIGVLLVLASLPALLQNETRPLVGDRSVLSVSRLDQYFVRRPELQTPYVQAAARIRASGCSEIGLYFGADDWEYPLWLLLREDGPQRVRIEHVYAENAFPARMFRRMHGPPSLAGSPPGGGSPRVSAFRPCAIVSPRALASPTIVLKDAVYLKAWSVDPVEVFLRK